MDYSADLAHDESPLRILSGWNEMQPARQSARTAFDAAPAVAVPAMRQILDEYAPHVWRTLHYCGVAPADLQDVCQEVFLVIHRKIGEFEGRSSMRTWVYQICLRVAAGYRRRARFRHEQIVAEPPELAVLPTQSEEIDERRARERLLQILDGLEPAKREVFVLFEIEEQSMTEIAETLGCPLRTAYSRLEAARKEIMRAWTRVPAKRTGS